MFIGHTFGVKNSLPSPRTQSFSPKSFISKGFYSFMFSIICNPFWFTLALALLLKRLYSSIELLCAFVKNQLRVSVGLFWVSLFGSSDSCVHCYSNNVGDQSYVVVLTIWQHGSPFFIVLFKIVWDVLRPVTSHVNFRISLSVSTIFFFVRNYVNPIYWFEENKHLYYAESSNT